MPYFDSWIRSVLEKESTVTMIARCEKSNDLLGLVIIEVLNNSKTEDSQMENNVPDEKVPLYEQCPDKLEAIFTFLDWTKKDLDVTHQYGVDTWADVMILVCDTSTRVPGLGTCLVKSGINFVAETGIKVQFFI